MAGIADLFKSGGIGQQLLAWSVLGEVITTALAPPLESLQELVWAKDPSMPLTPAVLAELVIKSYMDDAAAADEARKTGVNDERFKLLVKNTGEPISIEQALFALRRGVVQRDAGAGAGPSFMEAVRQSRVRTEWAPVLEDLQWLPLTPSEAVDAVVQSQIDYPRGEAEAKLSGVKEDLFKVMVDTRGNPPATGELLELERRGYISMEGRGPDATTVEQGVAESATKNKWFPIIRRLAEYLPPPRTVTALLHEGVISKEQAAELFKKAGLSDEMAAAYVKSASHARLQKARELALSTVLDLYEAHAVTEAEATQMVEHLGYDAHETAYLLALHDLQRQLKAVNAAIQRVSTLYVTRKIDAHSAESALETLGLSKPHRDELMAVWDLEREKTVRVLTPAQVAAAVYYGVIPFEDGVKRLVADGYTDADARVVIDVRLHGIPRDAAGTAAR